MARPTRSHVEHYQERDDGKKGCWVCAKIATRWVDFAHNGLSRFLSTAYCDEHGELELQDGQTTQRKIRQV